MRNPITAARRASAAKRILSGLSRREVARTRTSDDRLGAMVGAAAPARKARDAEDRASQPLPRARARWARTRRLPSTCRPPRGTAQGRSASGKRPHRRKDLPALSALASLFPARYAAYPRPLPWRRSSLSSSTRACCRPRRCAAPASRTAPRSADLHHSRQAPALPVARAALRLASCGARRASSPPSAAPRRMARGSARAPQRSWTCMLKP